MMKSGTLLDPLRLAVLLLATTLSHASSEAAGRSNIIFIVADDLGWSDLACYGGDLHETPNLDRFAQTAMRFTQAYAAAPVCSPTRASLMTGKTPARLHMTIWHESAINRVKHRFLLPPDAEPNLPLEEVTLAEGLKAAGYTTAHVGKWHLGTAGYYPEAQGFDINVGGTFWGAPQTFFYPFRGSQHYGGEYRYVPGLDPSEPGDYLTDRLTDKALKIIERNQDRPFFLNLCYHSVHTPVEGKPVFKRRYQSRITPGLRHRNAEYAAMVHSLDENIGRVLRKLDALALSKRTIIFFLSDNGGYIGKWNGQTVTNNAPLRSGKGSLYEGGLRIPMMVSWPGVTSPGSLCRQPVYTCDLYPTVLSILELTGDPNHNLEIDGRDLSPLLRHPRGPWKPRDLMFHYPHYYATTSPVSAIRSGPWKLLEYLGPRRIELYNLSRDLAESRNLVDREPAVRDRLLAKLRRWRLEVGAQMPRPNPDYHAK